MHGPHLALVTNQKEFDRLCKLNGLECDEPYVRQGWQACTHSWRRPKYGDVMCLVGIDMDMAAEMEPIDVAALIVHESVHVWQEARDMIGGEPGRELEAYAIQNISSELMKAYLKAKERRK